MYCFIPAWYNEERTWYDNSYVWYRKPFGMIFDDALNHLKMFQSTEEDSMAIVLNYMPNLRLFLHRYDLLESNVHSIFDTIQSIQQTHETIINYQDLNWPQDVEFITSPFLILARQNGKIIAQIEFGEEGYLLWIDYFNTNGEQSRRYVFDDRGFLSSILYYENQQAHHQDYLNLSGQWQIREYLLPDDQHVEINPNASRSFLREEYESIKDLIQEILHEEKQELMKLTDTVVIASHASHNDLVLEEFENYSKVLSFYQNRFPFDEKEKLAEVCQKANLVIVDQQSHLADLKDIHDNAILVSLFDARLSLGKSQRLKEQQLYVVLETQIDELAQTLAPYFQLIRENNSVVLNLVSYETDHILRNQLQNRVEMLLKQEGESYLRLAADNEEEIENAMLEDDETKNAYIKPRVSLDFLHTELDIMKRMEYSRLIIDLSSTPDLYTQIAGISSGIPQINRVETEFVSHKKNGLILSDDLDLIDALQYYLNGLAHWNEALVYSVQKINDYTSGSIVNKIISSVKNGKHK